MKIIFPSNSNTYSCLTANLIGWSLQKNQRKFSIGGWGNSLTTSNTHTHTQFDMPFESCNFVMTTSTTTATTISTMIATKSNNKGFLSP